MKLIITTVFAIALSTGIASASPCKMEGKNWKCPVDGTTYTIANATSAAEAAAFAAAHAAQQQGQSQSSNNDNSNGGNSVNIEGAPAHTTSLGANVGLNISLPVASGVQTRNAIDTANWLMQNGQSCAALAVMSKAPRVRNLKINFNCGDKG